MVSACALPPQTQRAESSYLSASKVSDTLLYQATNPNTNTYPGQSGVYLLGNPQDAFATRVLLAKTAERSIDIQYYIWENDVTGTLLLEAIHEAAERGVRIRMLLDDNGIGGLDHSLATLNKHPNVQIRLFNPFKQRSLKWLGYFTDFSRVNRRMHNKSFTADNSVTVIGGRNIGDDYFGATSGILKQDLDLIAIGEVVEDVSMDFDRYWQSESSYLIESFVKVDENARFNTKNWNADPANIEKRNEYIDAIRRSTFIEKLLSNEFVFQWSDVNMVSDDPAKGVGQSEESGLLINRLKKVLGNPKNSLTLVSPYFVPTGAGLDAFTQLAQSGKLRNRYALYISLSLCKIIRIPSLRPALK
jgi:putative cardiolipin synthase